MSYQRAGTSLLCGLLLTVAAAMAKAEDSPKQPPHFYRLDFVVKEVDESKVINSRSYTLMASTEGNMASVRTGTKVQVQTGAGQFTYQEIGINIDCRRLAEVGSNLTLTIVADVTSLPESPGGEGHTSWRQNRWDSAVILPVRKPTTILSSDDVNSKHKMQIELTATPVAQ